jgi:hypothetical protein
MVIVFRMKRPELITSSAITAVAIAGFSGWRSAALTGHLM